MTKYLEVNNLNYSYPDGHEALKNISFDLDSKESLAILGPNGAGKTTTMRIITGFMPPSEGNVTISGYDVLDEPLLTKNKIGYLPETPPLYLDMTVSEYLNFAGLLKQVPNQKINAAVDNACSKVDINDVKNKVITRNPIIKTG